MRVLCPGAVSLSGFVGAAAPCYTIPSCNFFSFSTLPAWPGFASPVLFSHCYFLSVICVGIHTAVSCNGLRDASLNPICIIVLSRLGAVLLSTYTSTVQTICPAGTGTTAWIAQDIFMDLDTHILVIFSYFSGIAGEVAFSDISGIFSEERGNLEIECRL